MSDEVVLREFYYTIPSLLQRIETEVLFKGRRQERVIGTDNISTIDAELLIREYLITISHEVFNRLTSPLGEAVSELETPLEPFEFDVTYNDGSTDYEHSIVYRMILPDTFNETTKAAILRGIEDVLVSYCVYQWLMDSNVPKWEIYEQKYLRLFDTLRLLTTRRKKLRRTYKLY